MKIFTRPLDFPGEQSLLLGSGTNSSGIISELYTSQDGETGLVDLENSTSVYDEENSSYGQGIVQTKKLYHSDIEIEKLFLDEITKLCISTKALVDISFDDGNTWDINNLLNQDIISFSCNPDGGVYKLKLKFNLGSDYTIGGTWTTTSNLNTVRYWLAGFGTTSNALSFGGGLNIPIIELIYIPLSHTTEKWNGFSWATTGSLNTAKSALGGSGTTTLGLAYGGDTGSGGVVLVTNETEKWNGFSWATTGSLNTGRYGLSGCGSGTNHLCFGGSLTDTLSPMENVEKWSGFSWSTTSSLINRITLSSGCGTTSAALRICGAGVGTGAGGASGYKNTTECWNGSVWTTSSSLSESKCVLAATGTTTSALCVGGYYTSAFDTTEIFNGSVWTTTSSLTVAKTNPAACGSISDALCIGADVGILTDLTEIWSHRGNQLGIFCLLNEE